MCHQNDNKQFPHSEDCLQLNVWTPKLPPGSSLPVMVWVHGGGNTAGSGVEALFNGEVLSRRGVVIVNVNYRLGVLGFFAHPDLTKESPHHASGNYGLADQILALRWVKENISRFGGNPSNVTIFGESAGANDVNALIASPLTKGLFVRVIAQSGPIGTQLPLADAEKRGVDLAAKLGFSGPDALAKLRGLSDVELMEKATQGAIGLNVDGWVLPEQASKIYAAGRQQKVALLIGNNSQEMQPRGAPGDIRQMIAQRYGPLADRALAAYGVSTGRPATRSREWNGDAPVHHGQFLPLRLDSGTHLAHRRGEYRLRVSILTDGPRAGSVRSAACVRNSVHLRHPARVAADAELQ
jgi:para-nitrobenzyl esterase